MRTVILTFLFLSISGVANSQVLISLLLGDKLNSDGLEFGLDGGFAWSDLNGANGEFNRNLHLGFYFDFKFPNRQWMVHTGVIVKSTMGTKGLDVYSLNDPELDSVFAGGSIERRASYFNVPIMMKYIFPQRIFLEGGMMLGLRHKAVDVFKQTTFSDDDTSLELDIRDKIKALDAGLLGGVGWKTNKLTGMYIGVRYYYGLVNISDANEFPEQKNNAIYVAIGVPIGAGGKTKTDDQE